MLYVDDDPTYLADFEEYFEGLVLGDKTVATMVTGSFDDGERLVKDGDVDALVVDLQEEGGDQLRGERVLALLKEAKFLPVVFYTGHAERIAHLQGEETYVRVVKKSDGFEAVLARLAELQARPAHVLRGALRSMLDGIEAEFFWGFVERHADVLAAADRSHMLAGLLTDRIAAFLQAEGAERLLVAMGLAAQAGGGVHPVTFYLIPPVGGTVRTCEILLRESDNSYALVLTPACDLALQSDGSRAAERVLLVSAVPLNGSQVPAFDKWARAKDHPDRIDSLAKFLGNRTGGERYYFLPGTGSLPDLVLDFQKSESIAYTALGQYRRIAGLTSPHAQEIRNKFVRWVGRVGIPVLDTNYVINRLRHSLAEEG